MIPAVLARPPANRPWHGIVAGGAVALAGLAAAGFPASDLSLRTAVYIAVVALTAASTWSNPVRFAWAAGIFLPIQQLQDVSSNVPELMSLTLVALVALAFRSELDGEGRRVLVRFLAGLVLMVGVQTAFGLVRDPLLSTLRFNGLYALTVIAAGLVVFRVAAYRPLLLGYLAGTSISSVLALGQAAGWNPIAVAAHGDRRFQGLALEPPGLSWSAAVAISIAVFVIWTTDSPRTRRAAVVGLVLSTLGLVVCGAQGGLVGLAVAAVVCLALAWRRHGIRSVTRGSVRAVSIGTAVLVGVAALAWAGGLGLSSLSGLAGDPEKGYENERARADAVESGVEQLLEKPLTGIGTTAYEQRYAVRPHVFALNLSVNNGIVGLLIGIGLMAQVLWVAVRGPTESWTLPRWLGSGLLLILFTHACLTPSGPFARIERLTILLIAMAVASGAASQLGRPSAFDGHLERDDLVSDEVADATPADERPAGRGR